MIFRQLFDGDSSTYTYIIADPQTKDAVIIDPVIEQVERDAEIVEQLQLKVLYLIETHVHADHITGGGILKQRLGGEFVAGVGTNLKCADQLIPDGGELTFGSLKIKALPTPGHTDGCTSWVMSDRVFTGDTLLIRGCGRTDFQQGSSEKLFESVRDGLFQLPDSTLVFPAHDYKGRTVSSIGEEKQWNPRLGLNTTKSEFESIMANLNLPKPKKIDQAVPGNLKCGV